MAVRCGAALKREIAKDAFHLETVWELLNKLKDVQMEQAKERQSETPASHHENHLSALKATYSPYLPLILAARARSECHCLRMVTM